VCESGQTAVESLRYRPAVQDFRNLRVWQAAHSYALLVYRATEGFPRDERFGLTSQLRRAAVSVAGNIAEGCGRGSDPDARRHFQIALGSACEALSLTLLGRDLGLLSAEQFAALESGLAPARRMLVRLIERTRSPDGRRP
jgi:four helix bundle protein